MTAPCCATTPIYFTRLGTFLERADNTARILDVKYYVLLPQDEGVGGALDYYQWQSILRSVSALRAYHWVYHERLQPWLIAELLILRPEMPRSLLACYDQITRYLELIGRGPMAASAANATASPARCMRGCATAGSRTSSSAGLHEFLTDFIDRSIVLRQRDRRPLLSPDAYRLRLRTQPGCRAGLMTAAARALFVRARYAEP